MAVPARRAVFTGLGVLSPVGSDLDTFFTALCDRKCGIRRIAFADPTGLPCQIGGELPEFNSKKFFTNKDHQKALRMMARTVQMGMVVAHLAFRDAGLEVGKIDPDRAGVEF